MSDNVPWYTYAHVNAKKSSSVEEFRWFVRERQRITKLKNAGKPWPWPWTKDEVLQRFHFCNIDRAEDRGTKYIVNKLGRLQDGPTLVFNVMLARFFNRPETFEVHGVISPRFYKWRPFYKKLDAERKQGVLLWKRAYLTVGWFNGLRTGDKLENYARVFEELAQWCLANGQQLLAQPTIASAVKMLANKVKGFKEFMATQVCLDLATMPGKRTAFSLDDDSLPIPYDRGSRWGLSDIFGVSEYDEAVKQFHLLMKKTGLTHVQTEQALCEFSKYRRLKDGRSNGRNRRYHGPAREQH